MTSAADTKLKGQHSWRPALYRPQPPPSAPIALVCSPHPKFLRMTHPVVTVLERAFYDNGFATLRFEYELGSEAIDTCLALDHLQNLRPKARAAWVAGFNFGASMALQVAMRRPEIENFVVASPLVGMYDFSLLRPCPCEGLVVTGSKDKVVSPGKYADTFADDDWAGAACIEWEQLPTGHMFEGAEDKLLDVATEYIRRKM